MEARAAVARAVEVMAEAARAVEAMAEARGVARGVAMAEAMADARGVARGVEKAVAREAAVEAVGAMVVEVWEVEVRAAVAWVVEVEAVEVRAGEAKEEVEMAEAVTGMGCSESATAVRVVVEKAVVEATGADLERAAGVWEREGSEDVILPVEVCLTRIARRCARLRIALPRLRMQ